MTELFPMWYRIFAVVLLAFHAVFVARITYSSWDALTGAVFNFPLFVVWVFGVCGGTVMVVACLVFAHCFGVALPRCMERLGPMPRSSGRSSSGATCTRRIVT